MKNRVVPTCFKIQGLTITGIRKADLVGGEIKSGFLKTKESYFLYLPHGIAENRTGVVLVSGALGLYKYIE